MAYNPKVSVVDYMSSKKMDNSYSNRAKLAAQYGIKGYSGSANQNMQLLKYLQQPAKPAAKPVAPKPSAAQLQKQREYEAKKAKNLQWFNNYTNQLKTGTNDASKMDYYKRLAQSYKLKEGSVSEDTMRNLSMAALRGDSKAAAYLKAMKLQGMTGSGLWKGYDGKDLDKQSAAFRHAYMKDNPYANYTKDYEMRHYDLFSEWINSGKPITDSQMATYKRYLDKWNLEDMSDPLVQNKKTLEKGKQEALKAQDVALNNGMLTQDRNNFQQFEQLQQNMSNRGISDSGMAADAYMRAQMAANANYQDAYSQAALDKSEVAGQYDQMINDSRAAMVERDMTKEQNAAELKLAQEKMKAEQEMDLLKLQNEQDKYLTASTGFVYFNGKVLMSGGKPITSLDYKKLSETQRHNLATENNVALKNAQDFALGQDKNAIARQKIAVDLQMHMSKMKLEYSKLDYNYAKLESNNAIAQEKIAIAAQNAQTSVDKAQITALGKQLSTVTSQITAYQKQGKKPPKELVEKYNSINNQLSTLVGGNF